MYAFDTGLPCQSSLLDILNISINIIQNKATQVMVKHCEVSCITKHCFYY